MVAVMSAQSQVYVAEVGDARPVELVLQIGLGVVDDDQIRLERQHPLHVRIEQSADAVADARPPSGSGRSC